MTGVLLGAAMLSAPPGSWMGSGVWLLRGSHAWIMLAGFMIQLALGVALWILPRRGSRPGPDRPTLRAAGAALNLGVIVVALTPLITVWTGAVELSGPVRTVGMIFLTAGIGVFVRAAWLRIQSVEAIQKERSR